MADEAERRCGDCRHWGTREESVDGETFRTCRAIIHDKKHDVDVRKDDTDDWEYGDEVESQAIRDTFRAAHMAVVQDGSGYRAALRCREDFGCPMFEPKGFAEKPRPDEKPAASMKNPGLPAGGSRLSLLPSSSRATSSG